MVARLANQVTNQIEKVHWETGGIVAVGSFLKNHRGLSQSYVWLDGVNMEVWTAWVLEHMEEYKPYFDFYPEDVDQFRDHATSGRLVFIKSKKTAAGQPREMWIHRKTKKI